MILDVYVDGSYSKRNPGITRGGIVVLKDNSNGQQEIIHIRQIVTDRHCFVKSNNVGGEIIAALVGIMDSCSLCNGEDSIINIYYDFRGIREYITGGFKKVESDGALIYIAAVNQVLKDNSNVELKFHKVEAHKGNKYNDLADLIAKGVIPIQYSMLEKPCINL